MVSGKKLLQMARKWHRMAVAGRRRISLSKPTSKASGEPCSSPSSSSSSVPCKGNFAVYTRDRSRFVVPLAYLDTFVFGELLFMSEEEFGLPTDGPIVMPCDAALMAQVVSLLRRRRSPAAEEAIIAAISRARCCTSAAALQGIGAYRSAVSAF